MQITLDLTFNEIVMLQDAVAYRYHQLASVVNNAETYPDQNLEQNEWKVDLLREVKSQVDRY
tara:strand:- start:17 stop:202 length:186 start_codon:yes stop_codon:yes gene_type:complete